MLKLHHAPESRSTLMIWLLEELAVPYEINYRQIRRADGSGRADPSNPHPDGKVPALEHDGVLVTEGAAIALYLTEFYRESDLAPRVGARDRGAYLTWIAWAVGELGPAVFGKFSGATGSDPRAAKAFETALGRILTALDRGPYLLGDRFTAADVLIGGTVLWGRRFFPADLRLDGWLSRIERRPARLRALEKEHPARKATAA